MTAQPIPEDPHAKAAEINLRLARESVDREAFRCLAHRRSPPKRMDGQCVRILPNLRR